MTYQFNFKSVTYINLDSQNLFKFSVF